MQATRFLGTARCGLTIVAALLAAGVGMTAHAADGTWTRGGAPTSGPRKTREELVREWDLNSDGKIDPGEAEVAASKMRRERAELRLNSGIDPITGRPRGEEATAEEETMEEQSPDADDAETPAEEEPADEDVRRDSSEKPSTSGLRVPRPRLPGAPQPAGKQDLNAARKPGMGAAAGSAAAADRSRRPLTGGARAGGLPAQAGYGSGVPSRPLNAGQPIVPKVRVVVPPVPGTGQTLPSRPSTTVTRPAVPSRPPAASREVYNPY